MTIIRSFRNLLSRASGRTLTAAIAAASLYAFIDPTTYLYALEVQRAKEAEVRGIAAKLGVDPEFLLHPEGVRHFDLHAAVAWANEKLGLAAAPQTNDQPLDVREAVARVKSRYALVAADTALAKIAALVKLAGAPEAVRAKRKGGIRGEIESALRLLDRSLLPHLPDGASTLAQARDRDARKAVDELRRQARGVINNPHALDDANLDATLRELAATLSGTLAVKKTKPRWTKDPFPLKDAYRTAAVRPAGPTYGSNAVASSAPVPQTAAPALTPRANAVAADVAALGSSLKTPAKIFTWVHDRIEWESYSGVAKGALGTLNEARGNDWDQALLLRDLLTSQGFAAQLEWGKVTLPITRAMNLVGTEDPLQAANLLATAGVNGQVLTTAGKPTAVQMTHAWVRAFIPFLPNRGATLGTADTWVRMDPSFKRYDYQPGIAVAASWSEDVYLNAGVIQAPVDHYADRLWSSIRANHLDCTNLGQIPKTGTIRAENFPFIPSTLTVHIDQLLGLAADPPAEQLQRVRLSLANEAGAIATTSLDLAETWGKKVTLTFPPATADDAAIIDSYGGLFNTPAYLVRLKPVVSVDDAAVAEGTPIAAGAALDLGLTFDQPNVASDAVHHDVVAGETHALVFDGGAVSDGLVATRAARLQTLTNAEQVLSEKLHLIGLRYMQRVDDGVRFAAGVRWHRAVKRTFEADVRRQIDVAYTIGGAPLRLAPAENNIDVARLVVGVVPIGSDLSHRAEVLSLAGMESSYREGAIWEEMESQQGISAAKALLLARRAGQQLYTVDAANVDVVLGAATLADDVEEEIRGAIAQGRVAKLAPAPVALGHWSGTGYILEDPVTGAATYPISGGLAGGSDTGEVTEGIKELLGSEPWLSGSPLGELLAQLLGLLGGGGDNDAPSTTQSDPVNLSSGNMYRSATDLSVVARGIPVALSRTYNSRSAVNGPFGYGWTFNYGETLTPAGDGSVVYRESDGTEHRFVSDGGAYVSPVGKHLTLAATAGGWTLTFKDGMYFMFDGRGLLVAQSDLNGNSVTINRDDAGNITTVVDASGRTVLTFTWTAGKISSVRDLGNRVVTYGYDGDDLVSVTDTLGKLWPMTYDLAHNMTTVSDPLGHTQTYDYDADDRLMHHVDATGAEEFFHYDIAARQSVLTDRRGGDRLIVYDDLGRATMEADPAGNAVRASFDAGNNRTSTTDSRGQTTAVEFDGQGNVTKQTAPDGGVTTTTYDALSRPLVSTDALGSVTTNAYDGSGNLLTSSRTVNGVSETTTNTYDSRGQMLTTTDANHNVSSMTWNDNGTLATRTDAGANTSTFTTDPLGRITSIKDPTQNETKLEYDAKDRIARMTDPYNNATSFAYDDAGRRTGVTTPRGTTTYTYDGEGRVVSVTDPLGHITRTSYSVAGGILARTDARGNVTRYEYDAIGRVTKMTDANGGVWTYGYCASVGGGGGASCSSCGGGGGGSFCDLTDPNGNRVHQEFDVMGRVVAVTDSLGHTAFTQYDKAGRKTLETDANGNATSYGYDEAGRLVRVTEASGAVTRYTYDKSGNKLTQKDANNHVWSFRYDALNRLIEETDPLSRKTTYAYDALGNLKTKTDAKNQTATYTYNIRRLMGVAYSDGTSEAFTYDALGRRTGMSNGNVALTYAYDTLNRLTAFTNSTYNLSVLYAYDAAGNRAQLRTMQGTTEYAHTDYAYDGKNRLAAITDSRTGTYRFTYDPMDRRTALAYPNGITTSYAYDKAYRLTALVSKAAAGQIVDAWSYGYDAVGNRSSKTDLDGKTESYAYDNVYRLTEARYADGTHEGFTYDPVGNRATRTDETGTTINYSYDVANQLLTAGDDTFTYDANGNTRTKTTARGTTIYTYDIRNRLTAIAGPEGTESNQYAPDGMRTLLTNPALLPGSQRLLYDTAGNAVYDSAGSAGNTWYRVFGPGVDEILSETKNLAKTRYLHHDALSSITAATDETGALRYRRTYKPFGGMTSTSDSDDVGSRYGFAGREVSVGSMMGYRARQMDTSLGRFLQQDSFRGNLDAPPSLNRLAYVANNATSYVDPSGQEGVPAGVVVPSSIAGALAMSATYGMLISGILAIIDNDSHASKDLMATVAMFSSVIGYASVFLYLTGGLALAATIGFGILSSAAVWPILTDVESYTICEVLGAFSMVLLGMLLTFFYGTLAGDEDASLGAMYAFTALAMMANVWGINNAMASLLKSTTRPFAVRDRECLES